MHMRGRVSDWIRRRQSFSAVRLEHPQVLELVVHPVVVGQIAGDGVLHEQLDSDQVARVVLDRVVALACLPRLDLSKARITRAHAAHARRGIRAGVPAYLVLTIGCVYGI